MKSNLFKTIVYQRKTIISPYNRWCHRIVGETRLRFLLRKWLFVTKTTVEVGTNIRHFCFVRRNVTGFFIKSDFFAKREDVNTKECPRFIQTELKQRSIRGALMTYQYCNVCLYLWWMPPFTSSSSSWNSTSPSIACTMKSSANWFSGSSKSKSSSNPATMSGSQSSWGPMNSKSKGELLFTIA